MRVDQQPMAPSGTRRATSALSAVACCLLALLSVSIAVTSGTARAQDTSATASGAKSISSFPKTPGGPLGGSPKKIDKTQPLLLQADELIYDTRNNRVIARGNVESYYNNYVLTDRKSVV